MMAETESASTFRPDPYATVGSFLDCTSPSGTALPAGTDHKQAIAVILDWLQYNTGPSYAGRIFKAMAKNTPKENWTSPDTPYPACWALADAVKRLANCNRRTVTRAINSLAALGLIEIRTAYNGRRGDCVGGERQGISLAPALQNYDSIRLDLLNRQARDLARQGEVRRARRSLNRCVRNLSALPESVAAETIGRIQEVRRDADRIMEAKLYGPLADQRLADLRLQSQAVFEQTAGMISTLSVENPVENSVDKIILPTELSRACDSLSGAKIQRESSNLNSSCIEARENPAPAPDSMPAASPQSAIPDRAGEKDEVAGQIPDGTGADLAKKVRRIMTVDFEAAWTAAEAFGHHGNDQINVAAKLLCGKIGISSHAWNEAVTELGALAPVALAVIDRNRFHPRRPVANPGGALRALTRRSRKGSLDLDASVAAIQWRTLRAQQPRQAL